MRTIIVIFLASVVINLNAQGKAATGGGFTDPRDGRHYQVAEIGNQVWMAENLSFNPGDGAWAYDDNTENVSIYGYLYDWETAKTVCPKGWHLPGEDEWIKLIAHLGGMEYAGGKMRETGSAHWKNRSGGKVNEGATNVSGFTAVPGGLHGEFSPSKPGEYRDLGTRAYWWSADDIYSRYAWFREIGDTKTGIGYDYYLKNYRLSVRCIKD